MGASTQFLDADPILNTGEIAAYLKIPRPTVFVLLQNGIIPATKIAGRWKTRQSILDTWFNNRLKPR